MKDSAVKESEATKTILSEDIDDTVLVKKILASFPSVLNVKNTEELIEKLRAGAPEALRHVMPSKEVCIEMVRGMK